MPGKRIDKKICVFESDDWGSIRMPSMKTYNELISSGVDLDKNPYNRYDSLETESDLTMLFDTLKKFRDTKGNPPKFTANFIMANPDFEKIESSGFKRYYFKNLIESYEANENSKNNWKILGEGIADKLFVPQFHAREHLNVSAWMQLLQENNQQVRAAFAKNVFCLDLKCGARENMMATFDYSTEIQNQFVNESIAEGLQIFKSTFKTDSLSMIAPCNVWGDDAEKVAFQNKVLYLQSLRGRNIPQINSDKYARSFPVMGSKNKLGQRYFVRNAYFEPATNKSYPWVEKCIQKIDAAFALGKPAIISTHRLNYIGTLSKENRAENLKMLEDLLSKILHRWNDVEFMSTDELGKYYDQKAN